MFVFKAAVVGAGTMGGQIAQTIAAAGVPVVLKDVRQELVDAGLAEARAVTDGQLARLVEKGRLTAEQARAQADEVVGRIAGTTSYDGFGDVDFVVEAVPERMDVKQAVFAELDAVTPGHAILASNTSSLSITEIGDATLRPDRVVGFHYFYPASVMPLVEVVEGDDTSQDTLTAAVNFAQLIRKQPITCGEVPGFVVNRILMSGMAEIWRAQEEGGLSIKAIDEGLSAQNVSPAGPFALSDLLGLDTVLHVAEHLEDAYGGDRFYVHQGIRRLVAGGKLGAKTGGEGVYSAGEPSLPGDGEVDAEQLADLLTLKSLVEACLLLEEGVAEVRAIDTGMMAGAGLDPRRGLLPPFLRADVLGLDVVLGKLEAAAERHGERFAPPTILRRLVAQGRLGAQRGQGFYAYPRPDADQPGEAVKLETRGEVAIAWLAHGQMNSIAPQVVADLGAVWERAKATGVRSLVVASASPLLFSAGADIKAFGQMDEPAGRDLL
ncbi:MAG TPA: 3-hydroxyacyl-CoA dehydrogenase NAD-binding domain-containing protein, partial [Solirubrobacteraceae bacterium]|nr:3-hydroxyacyl-CoA dehydrogenase NAD-binding domain-containing protein [Solirubrobacteraceae bacterium]